MNGARQHSQQTPAWDCVSEMPRAAALLHPLRLRILGALHEPDSAAGLARQALHAAVLGFVHPITGEALRFESGFPDDLARLQLALERL